MIGRLTSKDFARESLTVWISGSAIENWGPSQHEKKKRGRQRDYSDIAIETAHTVRIVYKKPLRQTEGFITSIFKLMNLDLAVPDHTTISRRGTTLSFPKKEVSPKEGLVVIIDSTGLKVMGEKERMSHKHGTKERKVWRKLHLCIDEDGEILSSTLTFHTGSDCGQVDALLQSVDSPITAFIGDGAYDNPPTYKPLDNHQQRHAQSQNIQVIVPPNTGFQKAKKGDPSQRLQNIHVIEDKGKLFWQNQMNYGRRARAENTMHRYKSSIGGKLKAKAFEGQITETKIAVQILNRMASLGMPKTQVST